MAAKTAAAAAWLALALLAGTCSPFTMPRHGHRRHQRRGAAVGEQEVEQKPIVRTAAGALQVGRSEIQTLVFEGDYVVHYERGVCQYAGRLQERDDDDGDGGGDGELPILLRFADRTVALEHREASRLTRLRGSDETVAVRSSELFQPADGPAARRRRACSENVAGSPSAWPAAQQVVEARGLAGQAGPRRGREPGPRARPAHARGRARSSRSRDACAPFDDEAAALLEAGLGYELTAGQRQCWEDVEEDMCRRLAPMDRLVGFGKTELAVRAAALAVKSGRQVAILAPTTVLAQQHYKVFRRRLEPLGITVEFLRSPSRKYVDEATGKKASSAKECRRVREQVASGRCGVCVGTHALLSPKQVWHALGLAVIDEEQRFGVRQKERLKAACVDVDVLTLSATPIPRTLGAALAGLRDTSELPDPPPGRGETSSLVARDQPGRKEDDYFLTAILEKELARGGQCFYVVPRIADVPAARRRLLGALRAIGHPAAARVDAPGEPDDDDDAEDPSGGAIAVAHGRVDDPAAVVADFAAGDNETRPVLLATTLVENCVENGLDLPRCNTIVIQDAHRFGLASLHQLRGRVGRGERKALAVFLYPRDGATTDAAAARLRAVADVDAKSGPELARRDLEIRGAGALLGTRQSGRASRDVGDEMYAKLLVEELERLRALDVRPADRGCDASHLPAAALLEQRAAGDADAEAALARVRGAPTLEACQRAARRQGASGPAKLAVKLRFLELHGARLGFESAALEARAYNDLTTPHGLLRAPRLNPKTWTLLRREVPEGSRSSLRFDETTATVEVVRLGALKPAQQVDFLLEAVLHMAGFLDRVAQVHATDAAGEKKADEAAEAPAAVAR
ncbi:helicase [Aureococcus anophagefferens]|nr:helicase [Aureococcus anophagefferens]